jgi:hypothetical protein
LTPSTVGRAGHQLGPHLSLVTENKLSLYYSLNNERAIVADIVVAAPEGMPMIFAGSGADELVSLLASK